MRFPWLQIDSDFMDAKASELGVLLGISRREALGLALDLWKWCLSRSPSDRPPDGFVTGSAPVPVLASGVNWSGDADVLVSALVEVGLLERVPNGIRLRGMGRYKATWEKNRRGGKGSGTVPDRNRTGTVDDSPPEPARKTQTQTQTQTQKETSSASQIAADAAPVGKSATETLALALGNLPAPEEAKKPEKPKKPPTAVTEFGEWCVSERAKAVPATAVEDTKLRPDQWARLGVAHRDYGRKLLEAAFLRFLAAPFPRSKDCPLGLFVGQLDKWLTEAKAGERVLSGDRPRLGPAPDPKPAPTGDRPRL